MREKYLQRLLDLLVEMEVDYRDNKLDEWTKELMWLLRKVLAAFWFYQIDALHQHACQFKLIMNSPVVENAAAMAKEHVDSFKADQ